MVQSSFEAKRGSLRDSEITLFQNAIQTGLNVAVVADSGPDCWTGVTWISYIERNMFTLAELAEADDPLNTAMGPAMEEMMKINNASVNDSVNASQENQVFFSEQLDFPTLMGHMLGDTVSHLLARGIDEATIADLMDDILADITEEVVEAAGSEARRVQGELLRSFESSLGETGLSSSTIQLINDLVESQSIDNVEIQELNASEEDVTFSIAN